MCRIRKVQDSIRGLETDIHLRFRIIYGFEPFFTGPMHLGLKTGPLCPHLRFPLDILQAIPECVIQSGHYHFLRSCFQFIST